MKFLTRWLSDSQSAHRPAPARKLGLEHLEARVVPAITLPDEPVAQGMVQSSNPSGIAGGFDPQALVNPIRTEQILTVYNTGTAIGFQLSTDFGQSWSTQSAGITPREDPLAYVAGSNSLSTFSVVESPSIAFDRTDHFYLTYIQRNAANTAGVLVVEKYAMVQNSINFAWSVRNLNQPQIVYRWVNQDPVFNPVVGVNSAQPTYTDPVTGQVQNNLTAGRGVYVAWNTNATPSGLTTNNGVSTALTRATVWGVVSDDAGVSYSTPQPITDGGFGAVARTGMDPKIFFTPSEVGGGGTTGRVGFLYNSGSSIQADVTDPFAGRAVSDLLTVQRSFSATLGNFGAAIDGAVTPDGGVLTRGRTDLTTTVTIDPLTTNFDFLADMEVTLSVASQDISLIRIELIAPNNAGTVRLLNSRQSLDGAGALQANTYGDGVAAGLPANGVPQTGIGRVQYVNGVPQTLSRSLGLTFDQQAARYVNDPANTAPYILRVKPEEFTNGGLNLFNGLTASQLSGTWTLRVTNNRANDAGPPVLGTRVTQWDMKFVSRVNTGGFGADGGVTNPGATSATTPGLTGTPTAALPTAGLQGWYSVAVDESLGDFSPFQGRVYVAYSDGTDIFLRSSDDGGTFWSTATRVSDDTSGDGISFGNRAKFQPAVTVDPTTGTVVVMWYDARWDASDARPATFIATSVDGGDTFSPNAYLNETKSARDAVTRALVDIEPVPNNLAGLASIGNGQAVVAANGRVIPIWTGNANAGGATLMTADTVIAGGPRVLQGDMGPVFDSFESAGFGGVTYNDTFTLDGTRQIDAFYVRFDRRIDPTTLTVADVRLRYQDTIGSAPENIDAQILSIQALNANADGATRFLVRIAPQARVGTYSYAVGPDIADRVRELETRTVQANTDFPVTLSTGNTAITSNIQITNQAPIVLTKITVTVDLANVGGGGGGGGNNVDADQITLRLKGPNGTVITLARENGGNNQAGTVYNLTTFDDTATSVTTAGTPFNNVAPIDNLFAAFGALTDINGTWTLEAINVDTAGGFGGNPRVTLSNWSIDFTDNATPTPVVRTFNAVAPEITKSYTPTPFATSTLVVSGLAINTQLTSIQVAVDFSDPALAAANASDLYLRLRGPAPDVFNNTVANITLAYANGTGTAGTAFGATVFDDTAATSIAAATSPFGLVRPLSSLIAAYGTIPYSTGGFNPQGPNGTWTLEVYNISTGVATTLQLDTWSLTLNGSVFQPGFPVTIPAGGTFTQTLTVPDEGPIDLANMTVNVEFTDPGTTIGLATDLQVRLTGPDNTTVDLVNASGTANVTAGTAFRYTVFQDGATALGTMKVQDTVVAPVDSLLTAFGGLTDISGGWTLEVINLSTNRTLRFNNWQLTFQGTAALGNRMDQDADGIEGEVTDAFSNPTPTGGTPFAGPYTTDSLPLIIPGPRVVSSTPNLTTDGSVSSIDLTFDKDMLTASFTPAQVLELRTPTGLTINGPFTVTANPPGTPPINANRVFRVTFPTQVLSGHYSLLLGDGIKSASGLEMDPNMNAGVELVTGRVTNPNAGSVLSSDYNTGTIGLAIPPAANGTTPSVTTHTLAITDQFFLTQLLSVPIQVRLNIAVPDVRDLSARLIAPDGTAVQLFTNVGGFGINGFSNFTNTQFSDFAAPNSLIQNAGAPFTGTFLPQQQLSVLNGLASAGDWKLEITNRSTTQAGTLNFWGLSLPEPILGNGLGEPVIDQTTVGFRVFTTSPSQPVSYTAWTPLGPTTTFDSAGQRVNGVVTVTAVDPSDPSGNTVYAGGATGGLWKTTNFLTPDAAGPTWIPLLDAASAKAMRISSIAIVPQNNNTSQESIVLVGTGDADSLTGGVGFLRSNDGGRTFRLIDSTVNSFNTLPVPTSSTDILPVEHAGRDHVFSSNVSYVYKVVVDPVRLANGEFVVYAAVGGDAAAAGLWRSITSGRSWTRIRAGEATDFVLGPNRVELLDANGNPVQTVGGTGTPTLRLADIGYAAFGERNGGTNGGVYFSQSISSASNMTLINGGLGKPLFLGAQVGNLSTNPNQNPTRILLAAVNATANNDPLASRVYQGWLYALVLGGGGVPGLYMTKDFGANWTLVDLNVSTNDESTGNYGYGVTGRFQALAADPTDPNVVYLGGRDGVLRVDVSTLNDAHAQVGADNSKGGVGPETEAASVGGLTGGPTRAGAPNSGTGAFFTRIRDPLQPFITSGTQNVGGTFTNTGENAHLTRLDVTGFDTLIRNVETMFDPLTRKTRVLVATERGVFTAADKADTTATQGIYGVADVLDRIGSAVSVRGNRSSNLALTDVTQTAVQPSELSADLAGLYNRPATSSAGQWIYSVSDPAYLNAPRGILRPGSTTYGDETWEGEVSLDPVNYLGHVEIDPQGSGTIYQYRPSIYADTMGGSVADIFSVTLSGQAPIGRTNGLFNPDATQWGGGRTAFFAVNPADPLGVVISAPFGGRVFLTTDQGVNWFVVGDPALFNDEQGTALAFGGRDPSNPTGDRNGFFYNGTAEGRIWVTRDAGSTWTEISAGLPTGPTAGPILQILANPRTGTYDAYAITARGVFYKADSRTAAAWVDVTGNLFSVTKPVFGETVAAPILVQPNAANGRVGLTALAVDWRYAVNGNTPYLYAAGDTGVFRSTDGGTAWTLFPANQDTTTLADDGGYLPNVRITDLDLVYGDLNSTGVPNQFNGRNVLIASTYGRSLYAVRLDVSDVPVGLGSTGPFVNTAPLTPPNAITGLASITLNFGDGSNPNRVSLDTLNATNMAVVGPNGERPTFTVTDISGLSGGASLLNTFRIDFTPPVAGTYRLQMNTDVRDTSGRKLNQDKDGTNGENPADFFIQDYPIAVNRPPTITAVPNQGLVVNTSSGALAFTIGDPDAADVPTLTVTRATSNGAVVPLANVVVSPTGTGRTVTVTPTTPGVATITLRVTDAGGRFAETTFTVSSVAAAVIPFTDTFTRPDAPNLGGNWVIQTGTAEVSFESTLATSPLTLATLNNVTQVNSVTQASVGLSAASGTSSAVLVARNSGTPATASMYYAGVFLENGAVTARIYQQVNGVATELVRSAAFAGPVAPQYDIRFEVVNDSLKLFVGGNLSVFAYDTAITTTGRTGFQYTNANRLDTFSADDIVLNPPVALPPLPATSPVETFTQANGLQLDRDWRDRVGNLSVTGNTAVGQVGGTNLSTYNIVAPTANAGAAQVDVALTAVNQVAGVVLRYTGTPGANADANYYLAQVRRVGADSVVQLYRNVNGGFAQLGVNVAVTGTAGTFRFEANGNQLKVFFNNVRVVTFYDTDPAALTAAGSVGLRTNQGGAADNFVAFALTTNATLPAADTFAATPPRNQLSSQWTERAGAFSVATGRATSTGVSLATLNGVSAGDVVVSALLPPPTAGPVGLGLVARFQNNGNFYWGALNFYSATQYMAVIWKYVNGTPTPVNLNTAVVSAASAVNGVLRFELLGSSLKLYLNDVLVSFGFDTTYTTGGVGLQLTNGAIVDDFAAAALTPIVPTVPGFADTFAVNPPRNTLSPNWQERSGAFSVSSIPATANRATGLSTSQPNLAVLNGNTALTNVTVAADLFFTGASQSSGLVLRYQGTGGTGDQNFYFADVVTQANGDALVRIRKDVNGTKTTLSQVTVAGYFPGANFSPVTAPRLQFRATGNTLAVFLDNLAVPLFSVTDATAPFTTGSVGIRTSVGAGVDNFLTS